MAAADNIKAGVMLAAVAGAGWLAWRAYRGAAGAQAAVSNAVDSAMSAAAGAWDSVSDIVRAPVKAAGVVAQKATETVGNVFTGTWTAYSSGAELLAGVDSANWDPAKRPEDAGFGNLMATWQGWRYYDTGYAKDKAGNVYFNGQKLT